MSISYNINLSVCIILLLVVSAGMLYSETGKYPSIRMQILNENIQNPKDYTIKNEVVIFDLWNYFNKAGITDTMQRVDIVYMLTALQGIVNREKPQLFIIASLGLFDIEKRFAYDKDYQNKPVTDIDQFWLTEMKNKGYITKIKEIDNLIDLINYFKEYISGITIWEMKAPATVNAAKMSAGCLNLLPVSRDLGNTYLRKVMREYFPDLQVKLNLSGLFDGKSSIRLPDGRYLESVGSAKNDVYRYCIEAYLKSGMLDPNYIWYNCDAVMWGKLRNIYAGSIYGYLGDRNELQQNGMYNADYWIAKKAFIVDLLPWGDTAPIDDPNQKVGTDRATWDELLFTAYKLRNGEFGLCGGFPAWWIKYTDVVGDKHETVPTEWEFIRMITSYNMANEGDAAFGISNASFYMHLPQMTKDEVNIPDPPKVDYKNDTTYVAFCMLDYDGSAWVNQMVPTIYNDVNRGKLPLNWCINPIIHKRIPHAMRYLYENRTENDFFGFADDGAGYINPNGLYNRTGNVKKDGIADYEKFAKTVHKRYGVDHTAFYIAYEFDSPWIDMAARIDKGFGYNIRINEQLVNGTPVSYVPTFHVVQKREFEAELRQIFVESLNKQNSSPKFKAYRCILMTPSIISEVVDKLRGEYPSANVEIVDLRNYYKLLHQKLSSPLESKYRNTAELSIEPYNENGLTAVPSSGGHFEIKTIDDKHFWALKNEIHGLYLCIDIDDAFAQENAGKPIRVEIEYLDSGSGTIGLQYDSLDKTLPLQGTYKESKEKIEITNSMEWKTAAFTLPDPKISNRENDGTDFRLYKSQNDNMEIGRIKLSMVK